jgi:hypothetical protein
MRPTEVCVEDYVSGTAFLATGIPLSRRTKWV